MKKLLAMSESTSEQEAMIATKRLHAMLAKHNISVADLQDQEEIGEDNILDTSRPWKRIVADSIARLYFCSFYSQNSFKAKKRHYWFVGSDANRTFAMHIFQMIVKIVEKEARIESRKLYGKEVSGFVNSFWTGAKDRICERCEELMVAGQNGTLEDEDGNTLPALLSTYERIEIDLNNWLDKQYGTSLSTSTARTRATNQLGFSKGQETGNKVQLSRTIQNNQAPKLIGG